MTERKEDGLILGREKTSVSEIGADDQGLIHWTYQKESKVSMEDALEECDACGRVLEKWVSGHVLLLIDIRDLVSITRDARRHFASKELSERYQTHALALVIGSPIGSMIGNIWQAINRPPHPMRLFTNPEKAAEWLLAFNADS